MDRLKLPAKVVEAVKKYRYALIVVLIGIVLMLIPGKTRQEQTDTLLQPSASVEKTNVQQQLEEILSKVKGAGKVSVMLSVASGEKTVYQTDQDITLGDNSTERFQTVIITGKEREQNGLIQQVDPETYLGAIVVCQGADSPAVRLSIVEAVSKITGLGADRISVLKMK